MKSSFRLGAIATHQTIMDHKAKGAINFFLCSSYRFLVKMDKLKIIIHEMQNKLRNRFVTREAKIEILETYWMRFLF